VPASPLARVLFDESHGEAWTIRPEQARTMQPAHPADASYAAAAALARSRDFTVAPHAAGPLDAAALDDADVLVLAHPSSPHWERTLGGDPHFGEAELDAIEAWVRAGGGLVVLGETEQDKYGTNVGALLERFGAQVEHDTVQDYEHAHLGVPSWVLADLGTGRRGAQGDLLARVQAAAFYRAGTVRAEAPAQVLARTSATASTPRAPLAVALEAGAGRVAVLADSDLFGDDCLHDLDHAELWLNLLHWAAGAAFAADVPAAPSPVAADPRWATLRDHTDALRLLQEPDGSIDLERHDADEVAGHVAAMADALTGLAEHVPHDAAYLEAAAADLRDWKAGGCARPDFARSLALLRPDLQRRDGIEHVVLLPMYLQNSGSRDTRFEALVVRVPWPDWLARLEGERYDNAKFVPVTFVDHTAGYDSECAVLFPETVALAGPPPNHFGAIFCDREAERFRRVVSAAADITSLNLPPDAAALLRSPALSQEAYVLWDLVHDRTHGRGDLPFDPFMIRQRMPFWAYALEELRCDLTAFGEAVVLEREGVRQARHVQYAILFDRLFRFPVTGARRRNYDGLGGQLLFAFLHRHGHLHWTDNRLTVEWATVADGVRALKAEVEDLYREGIDRSKLAQWGASHDLVARYVRPAQGSRWVAGVRSFPETEDPRPYLDEVLEDEFPLSMFYVQLKDKLAPALRRPTRRAAMAATAA
jgi:hypothetical protein